MNEGRIYKTKANLVKWNWNESLGEELKIEEEKIQKHSRDNSRIFKESFLNINKLRGEKNRWFKWTIFSVGSGEAEAIYISKAFYLNQEFS